MKQTRKWFTNTESSSIKKEQEILSFHIIDFGFYCVIYKKTKLYKFLF